MKAIIPTLNYKDADTAVEWLCKAFGFEIHQVFHDHDNKISHAELLIGDAMIMVGPSDSGTEYSKLIVHPQDVKGKVTQSPYLVIEDIDKHYKRAVNAGAKIVQELEEKDYGGKAYICYDPEGHLWNFGSYDPLKK